MIREQFIVCCPTEMIEYLKENECSNIQDILKWSKLYVHAHGLHSFTAKAKTFSNKNGSSENRHNRYGDKKSSSLGEKRDYSNKEEAKGNVNSPSMNNSSGKGKSLGQLERNRNNGTYTTGCYTCGDSTHFSKDCPEKSKMHKAQALVSMPYPDHGIQNNVNNSVERTGISGKWVRTSIREG